MTDGERSGTGISSALPERPLLVRFPALTGRVPWVSLGDFPTPVEPLAELMKATGASPERGFSKRDDLSSRIYGGNKVRTLEVLFGAALQSGATAILSTGALGSNHAVATALHAPRVGLRPGALLFGQPPSLAALENFQVLYGAQVPLRVSRHWLGLPQMVIQETQSALWQRTKTVIMRPGGATPTGALGYVSAALELAEQIEQGRLPCPRTVVVGVGSTCTSAGLLVGFQLAAALGIGFRNRLGPLPPTLVSVRVTPWPVTSRFQILRLAEATSRLLAVLTRDPSVQAPRGQLSRLLRVDGRFLGAGYGRPSPSGLSAVRLWEEHVGYRLDTTYSAKAVAAFLELCRTEEQGPLLYWSTKSTAPLPQFPPRAYAPGWLKRWEQRCRAGSH